MILQALHTQSPLDAVGPQAAKIEHLWWFSLAIATAVYLATIGMLCWALARARRRERGDDPLGVSVDTTLEGPVDERTEARMTRGVTWSVAATIVILLVFLGYDLSVGRTLSPVPSAHPLTIELTGHMWWWEATYADTSVHDRFSTANELHVPVGQPVLFLLNSSDVIHSLWVPNLAGKKDLIPGYTQSFWFQADTAGTYRGQCAEFCGHQHAKMGLFVIAEPLAKYQQWVASQRDTASTPTDSVADHGRKVFMTGTCAMCHSIGGTTAGSNAGPDLTHLASRRTIAAGTLPNTRGNLAGWIIDPQRIKPGAKMPPNELKPADLDALLTYLQGLK